LAFGGKLGAQPITPLDLVHQLLAQAIALTLDASQRRQMLLDQARLLRVQ
jgi:hypothetical protein